MEEFFKKKLNKCQLEEATVQTIQKICQGSLNKAKLNLQLSGLGKKSLYHSIIKHSPLLEALIQTLKREKMKVKIPQSPDSKDFNEIIKKHNAEKKLRKEILKLEEDELQLKFLKETAEEKLKEEEHQKQALVKKQQLLEELSQRAKSRQEDLRKKKQILEESPQRLKPRYVEMAENFKQLYEIPELERRKAELAKKRNLYQPISRQDWMDHMKKYNELSMEAGKKRIQSLEGKTCERINLVNKAKRELELENENYKKYKKSLVEKRKKYGEVVREVFAPKLESRTPVEIIEKPPHKELKKPEKSSFSLELSPEKPKKLLKKRKEKLESKTPELKTIQITDYLAEKRKQRTLFNDPSISIPTFDLSSLNTIEEKSKALQDFKKIDQILLSHDYRLRNSDPSNPQALELEETLNTLLTQSIKAKLSLL